MPGWMWMEVTDVVRYGIESVTREPPRVVAVPGRVNRLIAMVIRRLPQSLSGWIARRQARRWRQAE